MGRRAAGPVVVCVATLIAAWPVAPALSVPAAASVGTGVPVALGSTSYLWAAGGGAVGRTTPGLVFINRTMADGLGDDDLRGVYAVDDSVVAATAGGLSISTDGGTTFTNYTTANGMGSNDVVGVAVSEDTIFSATFGGGLGISTNGGATFTNRTTADGLGDNFFRGVFAVDDSIFAATAGGLSISNDGGATFANRTTANGLGVNDVYGAYAVGGTIYAATFAGLGISTDGGVTFTNRTTADGLGDDDVRGVYALGSTVYVALRFGGLGISTDGGVTFTNRTIADGLGSDDVRGVYVVGSTIYAGTSNGLSVSSDGGATFTTYTTADGLGSNDVRSVYVVDGTVFAATRSGLAIGVPPLVATPATASIASGTTGTVTISGGAQALPDGTVISAVSAAPGVAIVTSSVNSAGGTAAFDITGVAVGMANLTFQATGYSTVVVPITITAPAPSPGVDPTSPPSAPLSVTGVAGAASAVVSWVAPLSSGSFPVSNFQAVVEPGGHSCLVNAPTVMCSISGLSNGTEYTATVRALNGEGWGPYSAASAAFTPSSPVPRTITITGTRGDVRGKPGVVVTGSATGFVEGSILRPWIRFMGEGSFTQGTASIRISEEGAFTWQRRTGSKVCVSVRTPDGSVVSNKVIIPTR